MGRRARLAVVCAASLIGPGCTSHQPIPPTALAADRHSPRESNAQPGVPPTTERGLEVRQWLIADDIEKIAAAMAQRGSAAILEERQREVLRRNGLRLVRVRLEDLEALEADLGGASLNHVGWHGQVLQWQEIIARPLAQQRAFAIDGRVRMVEPGRLRLMARAWAVPMETGTYLNLQLVPQLYRAGPMSYYRLLGRETGKGTTFRSVAIDLLLEEGYAYLLTCESPLVDWPGLGDETGTGEGRHVPAALEPVTGPVAPTPTTLGQMMLRSERGRPGRGVLVFVPRIESQSEAGFTNMAYLFRDRTASSSDQ